jgi:hypothetical protein
VGFFCLKQLKPYIVAQLRTASIGGHPFTLDTDRPHGRAPWHLKSGRDPSVFGAIHPFFGQKMANFLPKKRKNTHPKMGTLKKHSSKKKIN